MSFIRHDAAQALRRYGEPALYAVLAGWGLGQGTVLILRGGWIGWVMAGIGAIAALGLVGAAERALVAWRSRRAGPGTVTIREGQIAYFAPAGGAVLALDALIAVDIRIDARGDLFWVLRDEAGQMVEISGGADGALALLDRLGSLKDFDHAAMVGAMRSRTAARLAIWRRGHHPAVSLS